jgi:sulfonate transport system substrate-binding protein
MNPYSKIYIGVESPQFPKWISSVQRGARISLGAEGPHMALSFLWRTAYEKWSRRLLVSVAAAVLLGPAAVAQNAAPTALRPIKVMTSQPTLTSAVAFTVLANHYDKAHGIAVEMLQAGGASSLMVDALISGNVDFATPGTPTALQAIREGADIKIIPATANNQIAAVINNETMKKLGVSATAPIADRIRALKGLVIGTNPVGSTYYQMLRSYLKQYGLDPDNDVRLVATADSTALISGVERGRMDAIVSASGVVEQAIGLNAATMWFSGARGDIPGSENSMVNVVITRSDMIEKRPADVEAYLAALKDALNAVRNDHAATGRTLKAQYFQKFDPELWDMVWGGSAGGYPPSLTFTKEAFDFWIANDPKGAASYKNVDYKKVVYGPAQSP